VALRQEYFIRSRRTLVILIAYILALAIFKWLLGIIFSSIALRADAISTLSDSVMAVTAFVSIYVMFRFKPSKTTPYGLYKLEDLLTLSLAALLFGISTVFIIWPSVLAIVKGYTPNKNFILTSLIAFSSSFISLIFAQKLKRISEDLETSMLMLGAKDLEVDSYVSMVVGISIILDAILGIPLEGIVSIFVGAVVIVMAILGGRISVLNLLDAWYDEALEKKIINIVLNESKLLRVRQVRFRRAGNLIFCNIRLLAPEELRLEAIDDILEDIETKIKKEIDAVEDVVFEVEPLEEDVVVCAIPIASGSGLDAKLPRMFEDAKEIAIFEVNLRTGQIKLRRIAKAPRHKNIRKRAVAIWRFLMQNDVDCVITNEISDITCTLLEAYSIDVYMAKSDNVKENLEALKRDELEEAEKYMGQA